MSVQHHLLVLLFVGNTDFDASSSYSCFLLPNLNYFVQNSFKKIWSFWDSENKA